MILFGIAISRAFTINFFADQTVSIALTGYLEGIVATGPAIHIHSKEQFFAVLDEIEAEVGNEGILINLLGHGSPDRLRFGETPVILTWAEVMDRFKAINRACGHQLVINATLMCYTDGLATYKMEDAEYFHAGLFSTDQRSRQALAQLINIFSKCRNADKALDAVDDENSALLQSDIKAIPLFGWATTE